MTSENPRPRITQNWRLAIVVHQLIPNTTAQQSGSCQWNLGTSHTQNLNSQHYLSFLVTSEDTISNNSGPNQQQTLTSNIPPATISNDKSLAAIFFFKLEEATPVPLFSGATLDTKPITAMYIDAKVDSHFIKLILDSGLAGSIIT
ncbi:hypothetical protein G9A89_006868 [Geosiphon pyriformis]|nr:hypothetical protein G9A89_006868 [Geosiphon pyriformis]